MLTSLNIKKLLIYFSVGVAAIIALIIFLVRIDDSTVKITTEEGAEIFFEEPFSEKKREKIGETEATVQLDSGVYNIIVEKNGSASRTSLRIEEKKKYNIHLNIRDLKELNKIASLRAQSVELTSQGFNYLDTDLEQIYRFTSRNIKPILLHPELFPINNVGWSRAGAVVELPDGFRIIKNGSIEEFRYPNEYRPSGDYLPVVISYSLSENGHMVFNFEGDIYLYESPVSKPRKIYSNKDVPLAVKVAENGNVLLFNHPDADSHTGHSPFLSVIDKNGNVVVDNIKIRASFASLSKNGKTVIYNDDANLYSLMVKNPDNPSYLWARPKSGNSISWISKDSYLVNENGSLWLQNIKSATAYRIAELPLNIVNEGAVDYEAGEVLIVLSDFNQVTPDDIYKVSITE